jgi:hypothetical protein
VNAVQAAAELGVNERTIRRAISDGRIPASKSLGHWDVDLEAARGAIRFGAAESNVYQEALAEALCLLRAFNYGADADDLERRYGLVYTEPTPRVRVA